jgi:hypothetical protein
MVMFRKMPILAAAVIVAAMSVLPASARNRPVVHNVTVDNSNYGLGTVTGPLLYPNSSDVEFYGTPYVVPKKVIAYWPTYGWYHLGGH